MNLILAPVWIYFTWNSNQTLSIFLKTVSHKIFAWSIKYRSNQKYNFYMQHKSRASSVGIATDYGLDDRMIRVRIPRGAVLFDTASRPALRPTEPPIQWVPGALFLGVNRPGREADHSPPYSAEVKECVELYLHSPICPHGVVLN
jgi:hypothetical protein